MNNVKLFVIITSQDHEVIEINSFGFNSKKAAQLADRELKTMFGEEYVMSRIIYDEAD